MSLPHLELYRLSPGQSRIQNNTQILDQPRERLNLTPKSCGSKNPWSFLFLVKATRPVL
jgi:hypothetical protein